MLVPFHLEVTSDASVSLWIPIVAPLCERGIGIRLCADRVESGK
jgi:hypothetical protein